MAQELGYYKDGAIVHIDEDNPLPTTATLSGDLTVPADTSASFVDGTVSATTSAAALGTSSACTEVLVQADPANTANVKVGNATSQNVTLEPGDSYTLRVNNRNLVYVKSVSGTQTVNYNARA